MLRGLMALPVLGILTLPATGDADPVTAALDATNGSSDAVSPVPWGEDGHVMAARAAVMHLHGVPSFFSEAGEQLAYLNPEPDRWRDRELREMDQAFSYDHYVDVENVPDAAREAADRYEYLRILYRETELDRPERDAGFLPFHIMELYQRLVTGWTQWHQVPSGEEKRYIEERIINDAGTLGHYVTDAAQPHHSTVHFNGWNAGSTDYPNPDGFTESRDFHARFESTFVRAHVDAEDVEAATASRARNFRDMDRVRQAVWAHIDDSNNNVRQLYRLERDFGFDPWSQPDAETVEFAVERLATGAKMLRDLWWSAYNMGRDAAARTPGGAPAQEMN